MKEISQTVRFLLGGGWWTLWYGLFYLIVVGGNFVWFGELYKWSKEGKGGPAGGAVFMGLLSMGGIPLLFFSVVHLLLVLWRGTDSRGFIVVFGLVLLGLLLVWMVAGAISIAEAVFAGFIAYYLALAVFVLINLTLLWVARQKSSLKLIIPFLF